MTGPHTGRRWGLYCLMGVLVFQGLSGLGGGLVLVIDPTGATIGLPLERLEGSPFQDFLVPGLVLLTLLGAGPLLVVVGLRRGHPWSRAAALGIGAMLLVWLAVQILVVGYQPQPPLQLLYGVVGMLILALAFFRADPALDPS
jgi:uncharacterized BrkB/YihY/UPF0761 family membrane protein